MIKLPQIGNVLYSFLKLDLNKGEVLGLAQLSETISLKILPWMPSQPYSSLYTI